jgi:hypothetical protein
MAFPGSLEASYTSGVRPVCASAFGEPAALLLAECMPAASPLTMQPPSRQIDLLGNNNTRNFNAPAGGHHGWGTDLHTA